MQTFSASQRKFIQDELIPLNLGSMKDCDKKVQIESLLSLSNPNNLQDFTTILDKLSLTKQAFFEKAFNDTLYFFFENTTIHHFSKEDILIFKEDFLYLVSLDIFKILQDDIIIAHSFLMFLNHLNLTFDTLDHMKFKSDSLGTAFFNNDYRVGLESILNDLIKQLSSDNPFVVSFKEDIERIKLAKFAIKSFRNHIAMGNFMVILNSLYGFNNFDLGLSEGEQKAIEQIFTILNGLKTSDQELVRSFMIKATFPYRTRQINKTKLCDFIKNITRYFFEPIIYNKTTKKYKVSISARYLEKPVYIKTALMGNLIYAYDNDEEYCHLFRMNLDKAVERFCKLYIEAGLQETVNHPAFKPILRKVLKLPVYPLF